MTIEEPKNLPLIIKRIGKVNFTEKRNPYKKYQKAKWNWIDIFLEIESLKDEPKIFKNISQKYNINYSTLRNKYSKFKNEKTYNELDNENRGANKIFTENEEMEIYMFLKESFIDKHKILCNDIIKIHAVSKFEKLYVDKKFNASDGWCNMFKKRWNLSTVKITTSKIATKTYTDNEINLFLKNCKDSLLEVGQNFFSI